MKNLGRLFLAIGSIWLVLSTGLGSSMNVPVTSQLFGSLSTQETFRKSEVQQIIDNFYKLQCDSLSWPLMMLAPACLMLIGGFIVDRFAERKGRPLGQVNSN